jgi:uncharacterized protein DUF4192
VSSTENSRAFRRAGVPATLDGMTNTPLLPKLTLRSPADLVAAVPYLLGFHPTRSVVAVGFAGRQLVFAGRHDLPDPGEPPTRLPTDVAEVLSWQRVDTVALLGYGPTTEVDPLLHAVSDSAERHGLVVREILRVDEGRWWSYVCHDPTCCPPEGTPIDLASSEVPALCTMEGLTAAASREDYDRQLAPVGGLTRTSMAQATGRARSRYARILADRAAGEWEQVVLAEGTAAVREAFARYEGGGALDDDELAWLSLLLDVVAVRDVAWQAIAGAEHERRLWTDVTRRAEPGLVAAPATLLAFAAWRAGDGVLAGLALERALQSDPAYSMAHLLLRGLQQGLPPSEIAGWLATAAAGPAPGDRGTRPAGRRRRQPGLRRKPRRQVIRRRNPGRTRTHR